MAHSFDTNLRFTGSGNPFTSDYTCGSNASLLVLGIVTGSSSQRSGGAPTYNGTELTQADETRIHGVNPEISCELWYLLVPDTGSVYSISIPNPSSLPLQVQASSYIAQSGYASAFDVDGGNSGTSASPSVSVTTTEDGDVIVGVFGDGENFVPTGNTGTELNTTDNGLYSDNNQYTLQSTAGAVATGWTTQTYGAGVYGGGVYNGDDDWCMCVASFKESDTPITVEPDILTLSLSILAPSVTDGDSIAVSPAILAITATLDAGTASVSYTDEDTIQALTMTLNAPVIGATTVVTPSTLSLNSNLGGVSIVIQADVTVVTSRLSITASVEQPNTLAPLNIVRMMPFIYSSDIAYPIEMGEKYARFYYDGEPLLGGSETHVEVTTPYTSSELYELQTEQSADVMWSVHRNHPQSQLKRVSPTSFELEEIVFNKGPFIERNDIAEDDGVTMDVDVLEKGESGILTRSSGKFESGHIGALFELTHPRINYKTSGKKLAGETGIIGDSIEIYGNYTFSITTDGWYGTIVLQRSEDAWVTSTDVALYNASKRTYKGSETTKGVQYRINVTAHTIGTISASLSYLRSAVSGSASATGVIGVPLDIKGAFNFNTHGNWDATVAIERNENEAGWEPYREYISVMSNGIGDRNVQFPGIEEENNVQYRINVTAYFAGTVEADISATSSTLSGIVRVNGITSDTSAEITVVSKVSETVETKRWAEGAWSGVRGYPSAVTFFEERIIYGFTELDQQTIWISATGKFEDFEAGILDADSFALTLPTANRGRWLGSLGTLAVGDSGNEWRIKAPLDEALTPTNWDMKKQTAYGSNGIQAIEVGSAMLFVDSVGRKIREFTFSDADQRYLSPDLTSLAEHVTVSGIVCIAHQKNPDSILWCVLDNGNLLSMTYERDQDVVAWAVHPTDGLVQSVSVIPAISEDEIWISIVRAVNGDNKIYIEKFESRVLDIRKENSYFVDSGIIQNSILTSEVTGLDHLENKVVAILADGEVIDQQRVVGGKITLATQAINVRVGLPYTSLATPMRLDLSTAGGTNQGSIKKISEVVFNWHNTMNAKYGASVDKLFDIDYDNVRWKNTSEIEGLFTGMTTMPFDGGYDTEDSLVISQSDPLPCTVRAIIPRSDKTGR